MPAAGVKSFGKSAFKLLVIAFSIAGLLGLGGCSGCSRPEDEATTSPSTEDPATPGTPTSPTTDSPATFGVNGVVTTGFDISYINSHSETAFAVQKQSDGKILIAGEIDAHILDFALMRLNTDGSIDTTFGNNGRVSTDIGTNSYDYAKAMTLQSDGKILLGGFSNASGSNDFTLVRYNTNGSLDTSFGTSGKVTTDIGTNSDDLARAIAIQSDGKILLIGHTDALGLIRFTIVRYNTDGSLDTSFGGSGKVTTLFSGNAYAYTTVIQSDGKILIAGESIGAGSDFTLARYNTDGSIDTSFGTSGKVITNFGAGSNDTIYSIALQSDGKIVAAGLSTATGFTDFALIRYNTDGSIDTSFGTSGKVTTDIGTNSYEIARSISIQNDGKIMVAGHSNSSGTNDFAVLRYNTDGSLDTTFGASGMVITDIGTNSNDGAFSSTLQSDGKILITGESNASGSYDFTLVRYNTNGSLDTSFGIGGKVLTYVGSQSAEDARTTAIQSDGKILVAGKSNSSGHFDFVLLRHNTDGSLDTSFGTGGKVITDIGTSSADYLSAIRIQSDGKILVVGESNASGSYDFTLVRYNTDGSLDTSFGTGGKVITDIGTSSYDNVMGMAIQSDGKIVVAGGSDNSGSDDFALARYNSNGTLDTSFGTGGKVTTDIGTGSYEYAYTMAIQNDGKIIVAGNTDDAGTDDFTLVRYNTNGSLDTSFGTGGKVITDISGSCSDYISAIAIQSDGKILAAGYTDSSGPEDFVLVRYNADGSLDTNFGSGGKVTTDIGTNTIDKAKAMAIQSDGKILLAGNSDTSGSDDFTLARYNTDGSLDTSFGSGGKVTTDIGTDSSDYANSLVIQSDGKFFVAGSSDASGSDDFILVRYNADGSK